MGTSIESGGVTVIPKSSVSQATKGVEVPELKLTAEQKAQLAEFDRVGKELQKLQTDGWDDTKPTGSPTAPPKHRSPLEELQNAAGNVGKLGEGECAPRVGGNISSNEVKFKANQKTGCPPKPLE